ncbi:MAG: A/G-specific adenine glycosylase [Hyphomicrobiales bacterium]|nr:A/G-specific adenine glycosylase [Hyphomicrobiales bacterium]
MSVAAKARRKKVIPLPGSLAPAGTEQREFTVAPQALLRWYDRHRRVLPWRAGRGERADPYRVWLSEIMLQQTTVKAVAPYYAKFLARFPTVTALAQAPLEDVLKAWAGLGYYARARNLHACARALVAQHGGAFPDTEEALRALPGIGAYTAAAVAAIAFDRRASPVDGNIERVIARLFAVEEPLPGGKSRIRALARELTPHRRAGDFAQAMMDLGATICTPKKPACVLCPWCDSCATKAHGDPERLPAKPAKSPTTLRRGAAYAAWRADGMLLVRKRPERGLLGGMTEVPTTEWSKDFDGDKALEAAPLEAAWRRLPGVVTHTFTHFPLELTVYLAKVPRCTKAPPGTDWLAVDEINGAAFPNVMRKVIARAIEIRPSRQP